MYKLVKILLLLPALLWTAQVSADVTLKLAEVITTPRRTETLQSLIDQFSAAHPDISVELIALPWDQAFAQLNAMMSGGDTPDVVEMPDTWVALYTKNNRLENLDPYIKDWAEAAELTNTTRQLASRVSETAYIIPHGFYPRALFYNIKLFREAGIEGPPQTMEDFMTAAKKVSALPDKYGYCLHGGAGGINSWLMFAAAMNGTNEFFDEAGNSRINEPDSVAGIQFLIDVYQNGYAPKDSINWGFGETVAAFYSGSCAMLDQDPDALALIAQNMAADDFAVAPMPLGPAGKAFPTIGFAGWSMLSTSEYKKEAWQLISYLSSRAGNLTWSKQVGVIPVYQGAEKHPYFAGAHFQGWFTELNDERYVPTLMPTYLDGWATFADVIATQSSQEALLNVTSARRVADRWAEELTQARKKWRRTGK